MTGEERADDEACDQTPSVREGTLLVVDDNDAVRKATGVMAKQLGYDVIQASGGREAIEIYRDRGSEITLVLLDLVMPEMNGAETFAALRDIDPDAVVLLCSGYDDGQAADIMAAHSVGFLQKPYSAVRMAKALDKALGQDS